MRVDKNSPSGIGGGIMVYTREELKMIETDIRLPSSLANAQFAAGEIIVGKNKL